MERTNSTMAVLKNLSLGALLALALAMQRGSALGLPSSDSTARDSKLDSREDKNSFILTSVSVKDLLEPYPSGQDD